MERFIIIIFLALLWSSTGVFSQQTGGSAGDPEDSLVRTIFESVLLDVENLQLTRGITDSLFFALKADARELGAEGRWTEALEVLNTLLDLFSDPAGESIPSPSPLSAWTQNDPAVRSRYALQQFEIESGVDYSQQEFEVALLESDSVLVEELQNPYVSLSYSQPYNFGGQQLFFSHRLRMDNQFFTYNLFTNYEKRSAGGLFRVEMDGSFYYSQTSLSANFFDNRLRVLIGDPTDLKNRWYLIARGRYKAYTGSDLPERDILSAGITSFYEHFFSPLQSVYFTYTPAIYREKGGYAYWKQRLEAAYRYWKYYNRFVEFGIEGVYYQFETGEAENFYENRYVSVLPKLEVEWNLFHNVGFRLDASAETRSHRNADAINPDFNYYRLQLVPKYYLHDTFSISGGYFQEAQQHRVNLAADTDFARQADFQSRGVVGQLEYLSLNGIILNLEYRATWREYPHAETSILNTYYADRFVHSLSLLGWVPVTRQWFIQLFANYDNDQDRTEVPNDTRSTLLNLGIIYKF